MEHIHQISKKITHLPCPKQDKLDNKYVHVDPLLGNNIPYLLYKLLDHMVRKSTPLWPTRLA